VTDVITIDLRIVIMVLVMQHHGDTILGKLNGLPMVIMIAKQKSHARHTANCPQAGHEAQQ